MMMVLWPGLQINPGIYFMEKFLCINFFSGCVGASDLPA